MKFRTLALAAVGALFLSFPSLAQTGSLEGTVKGEDGKPLANALIKIERKDIKGNYKVKTKKKGDFFHAGLPLGMYRVILEVDGKDRDFVDNIRVTLGDPTPVNFDMQAQKQRAEALQKAAESGTLTKDQAREMSAEQREAIERQMKERAEAMRKNKALNDAFTEGTAAMQAKNFEGAVAGFQKAAAEVDPNTPDASQKKNVGVVNTLSLRNRTASACLARGTGWYTVPGWPAYLVNWYTPPTTTATWFISRAHCPISSS